MLRQEDGTCLFRKLFSSIFIYVIFLLVSVSLDFREATLILHVYDFFVECSISFLYACFLTHTQFFFSFSFFLSFLCGGGGGGCDEIFFIDFELLSCL